MSLPVCRGKDAACSIGDLAERAGISHREMERRIEAAVKAGTPVIACATGVYIATSAQEARQYASSLKGRIVAVQARISALERWADGVEVEQTRLPWSEDRAA